MYEATKEFSWPGHKHGLNQLVTSKGWLMVIGWLLLVYVISNYLLPRLRTPDLQMYVLQPVLWLSLGELVFWLRRQESPAAPFPIDRQLVVMGAIFGVLQITLFLAVGIFIGFGHSPYARNWYLLILNLWFVGSQLVGLELARWYLVKSLGQRYAFLGITVAWLLMTLVVLLPSALHQFDTVQSALRYSGQTLLPTASESLLATYLALAGGPLAAIAYRAVLVTFEWLSPILPNLHWLVMAFLGTILPVLGLILIQGYFLTDTDRAKDTSQPGQAIQPFARWILMAVLAVLLIWFNVGTFGVQPNLISGYSMKPTFVAGDIVITRDVPVDSIQVGDVIRFRQDGVHVLHRVVAVEDDGHGENQFITLGDNNNTEDPPVTPDRLAGKAVLIIPNLGWISIVLRQFVFWLAGGLA